MVALCSATAHGRTVEVETPGGSARLFVVQFSKNGRYFARGEVSPEFPSSNFSLIEIFETSGGPGPAKATEPLWSASIPSWDRFWVSNTGASLIAVAPVELIAPSKEKTASSRIVSHTGVVTVSRGDAAG